ncbi:MAG: DUF4242 domain-containing protein [Chloroflexi bacterium]|nr:DUF4242 domain-containing protein [Chloroflexota bacterium]
MAVVTSRCELKMGTDEKARSFDAIANWRTDEFGVRLVSVYYNDEGRALCINEAPNAEAVRKSHDKLGLRCDEIQEMECLGC